MQILAVFQVSNVLHTLSVQIDSWIQNSQYEYFFFFQVRDLTKCGRDRFIYSIFTPLTKGSWSRFVISPYKLGSRYLVMQDTGCKGKLDMDGS